MSWPAVVLLFTLGVCGLSFWNLRGARRTLADANELLDTATDVLAMVQEWEAKQ